jgi:hypothetical protein
LLRIHSLLRPSLNSLRRSLRGCLLLGEGLLNLLNEGHKRWNISVTLELSIRATVDIDSDIRNSVDNSCSSLRHPYDTLVSTTKIADTVRDRRILLSKLREDRLESLTSTAPGLLEKD